MFFERIEFDSDLDLAGGRFYCCFEAVIDMSVEIVEDEGDGWNEPHIPAHCRAGEEYEIVEPPRVSGEKLGKYPRLEALALKALKEKIENGELNEDAEKQADRAEGDDSVSPAVESAQQALAEATEAVEAAKQRKDTAQAVALPLREAVLSWLRDAIRDARFREDEALRQRKFIAAELDAAKAERDIALRKGASDSRVDQLWQGIRETQSQLTERNLVYEDASAHRRGLQEG